MATSSITESFYCDDPKAANAIVRLLFSKETRDSWRTPKATGVAIGAEFRTDAQRRSFADRLRRKYSRSIRCVDMETLHDIVGQEDVWEFAERQSAT